jgi:hypothetical protein
VRVCRVLMVYFLQVSVPVMLFELNAPLGRSVIQAFTAHNIGNTQLEWGYDPHMQNIAAISQQHLRSSTDDHDMPGRDSRRDDPAKRFLVGMLVCHRRKR